SASGAAATATRCLAHCTGDFCAAVGNFCTQLPPPHALWVAAKASDLCSASPLLHLRARLLCEQGQALQAVQLLRGEAERVGAESSALVLEGLGNAKNVCVDRWHFRMLNDKRRNEAYDAAIRAAVRRLGAGCTGAWVQQMWICGSGFDRASAGLCVV